MSDWGGAVQTSAPFAEQILAFPPQNARGETGFPPPAAQAAARAALPWGRVLQRDCSPVCGEKGENSLCWEATVPWQCALPPAIPYFLCTALLVVCAVLLGPN